MNNIDTEILHRDTFKVGEVFFNNAKGIMKLDLSEYFENVILKPAKERTISLDIVNRFSLIEYILPKDMCNTKILENTYSVPPSDDEFWAILYLLIFEPYLGKEILNYSIQKNKKYVLHRTLPNGNYGDVTISPFLNKLEICGDNNFGVIFRGSCLHREGRIFLYPNSY
ncbi:MAG: hypothetical protein WCI41_00440 [bacterium]